ncbi:SRPBCC domain-containing protein [Paludisphaera mucosa]|uniref:SRPBCC domain-containing protein n=1 Tax=Paludisphaera mucosa TaxID=3030827 RepID=A0ABT6FIT4_9BACT|nr:SRPBCC domain-containing protein [Paludisphaera mucosa]MDG3007444.1 SRPBCC domain-containing protein [Paludisphaera mucosa]
MTTFSTERAIPAGPSAVFAAFEDPARLARWWGPDGFSNTFDTFEFRPGGLWIFSMHGPTGTTYPNEALFASIVPDREVVIRHVSQPHFELTVRLQEHPAGTLVAWDQAFDDDAVAEAVRHIVVPANEQNLDRLSAEVASDALSAT